MKKLPCLPFVFCRLPACLTLAHGWVTHIYMHIELPTPVFKRQIPCKHGKDTDQIMPGQASRKRTSTARAESTFKWHRCQRKLAGFVAPLTSPAGKVVLSYPGHFIVGNSRASPEPTKTQKCQLPPSCLRWRQFYS